MRAIRKGVEPPSLTTHRAQGGSDYENYADKDTLRACLVREQLGLCCYCMSRIGSGADQMKIEHWHAQNPGKYPQEQLDYRNLLASCKGGDGQHGALRHCDTSKGDSDLLWNPAADGLAIEEATFYRADGKVYSKNTRWDADLNNILHLNLKFLEENRRQALAGFVEGFRKVGGLQSPKLEKLLRHWLGEDNGSELKPFAGVIVYWLRKRLARA
jgi:uncharacterized protein (TIGR02646 family)